MKKIYKPKTVITIFVSAFVIVLSLFGANWQIGQAETITLPEVYSYEPQEICVNSLDTLVTVYGKPDSFITPEYTWILWLDSSGSDSYIIPDEIIDGVLKFTVVETKLTEVYTAAFWIENHPVGSIERTGPFYIDIIGCEFIYLPLVMK